MMRRLINRGRKPTQLGSDGIPPFLDVEHRFVAGLVALFRTNGIIVRVKPGVSLPAGSHDKDLQMDRVEFADDDVENAERIIVRSGARVRPESFLSQVQHAALIGDIEALRKRVSLVEDINKVDDYMGNNAAHWLASGHDNMSVRCEALDLLVRAGVDLNARNAAGQTVLAVARSMPADPGSRLVSLIRSHGGVE